MRLFHATEIEHVPSILKHGLKSRSEGVYLSGSSGTNKIGDGVLAVNCFLVVNMVSNGLKKAGLW